MSMAIDKRVQACTILMGECKFNTTLTIEQLMAMEEFRDDPYIRRQKYPEARLLDIITMGGEGDQKQMNIHAFTAALAQHTAQQMGQVVAENDAEKRAQREREWKLEQENAKLRDRLDDKTDEVATLQNEKQQLQSDLHNARLEAANKQILALKDAIA